MISAKIPQRFGQVSRKPKATQMNTRNMLVIKLRQYEQRKKQNNTCFWFLILDVCFSALYNN